MKRVVGLVILFGVLNALCSAQGYLIARLRTTADPNTVASRYGLTYLDQTDGHPVFLFGAPSYAYAEAADNLMQADSDVVWAEEDADLGQPEVEGLLSQTLRSGFKKGSTLPAVGERDALYKENTNLLQQIGFSPSLALSPGRPVKVAILDTGLTPTATYMWQKVAASVNFVELGSPAYDIPMNVDSNNDGSIDEGTGHGSMVAGLIDQMAPLASLVIVRVADSDGEATVWSIVKGLSYAVDQGCEVANVSFGTFNELPALKYMVDWCDHRDLLVVAPIGNDNLNRMCYPAALSDIVSVAGLSPDNTKAPFSNYNDHCDFSAPATGIASAWWDGDWATWSGTSLASPLVAGVITDCLRRTKAPMEPEDIREKIHDAGLSMELFDKRYGDDLGKLLNHVVFDTRINGLSSP